MADCIIFSGGGIITAERPVFTRTLGAYRIASSLIDEGYTCQVIDHINHFTVDEMIEALKVYLTPETLWVGYSSTFVYPQDPDKKFLDNVRTRDYGLQTMYHHPYDDMVQLFDYVRAHSQAKIVFGGARSPFFTIDPQIDYYVFGNADVAVVDLTNYLAGRTDHIAHLQEIELEDHVTNTSRGPSLAIDSTDYPEPPINNISTHWWRPDFNVLPGESLPIEMARGCIFKCKFCSFHLLGKKKGTYLRNNSQVRDELIKTYETTGTANYWITDDTFNDDNDKIEDLHRLFTSLPFKIQFSCYLRIDLLNKYPHQAVMLKDMGLVGTFFGIETLNHKSGVAIGKGLAPTKVKDRLYWLREQWRGHVNMESGMILGLPYDTPEYFYDLLKWSMEPDNPLQSISFNPLSIYHYHKRRPEWDKYSSEFSLNPEVYGYEFDDATATHWRLPQQNLTYRTVERMSREYNGLRGPMNLASGFNTITLMNMGARKEDLMTMRQADIFKQYDLSANVNSMITQYKQLLLKT